MIWHILFSHYCVLCGNCSQSIDLCIPCQNALPLITNNHLEKVIAAYRYEYPLTHLIQTLKFQENLVYANILGNLLAEKLLILYQNHSLPELILPVPLHRKRLKERGFNQALEIAKTIAKRLKIPIDYSAKRIKSTRPQAQLTGENRMQNLENAFFVPTSLKGRHVAVVDDVITTGATIQAFSLALKKAGVVKIDIWCVARASTVSV